MPDVVTVFQGQYEFLSNFHEAPLNLTVLGNRMLFPSSEAAYQALKHRAMPGQELEQNAYVIRCAVAKSPGLSKKVGRSARIDAGVWDSIKDEAMREVVFAKFDQNLDLRKQLLDTGATLLVEGNTWGDVYWGRSEGRGQNRLGSILMEVRGFFLWDQRLNSQIASSQDWS